MKNKLMTFLILFIFLFGLFCSDNSYSTENMKELNETRLIGVELIAQCNEIITSLNVLECNQQELANGVNIFKLNKLVELWKPKTIKDVELQISANYINDLIKFIEDELNISTDSVCAFVKHEEKQRIDNLTEYNLSELCNSNIIRSSQEFSFNTKEFDEIARDLKMKIKDLEMNMNHIKELIVVLKRMLRNPDSRLILNQLNKIILHFIPITMEIIISIHIDHLNIYTNGKIKVNKSIENVENILGEIERRK